MMTIRILLAVLLAVAWWGIGNGQEEYLYAAMDPEESWPIKEYQGSDEKPVFLTNHSIVNRVVEFYAPWCPHCKHFKPRYIEFGRRMSDVAKQLDMKIEFYAVSCSAYHNLCQNNHINSFPTVKIFKAMEDKAMSIEYWRLHPFAVLRKLGIQVEGQNIMSRSSSARAKGKERLVAKFHAGNSAVGFVRTKDDIFNDAFLSFDFALRTSIFMTTGALNSNSTKPAFNKWTELLSKALPPTWKIQPMLTAIRDNFAEAVQSEEALLEVIKDHRPKQHTEWSKSCTKGDPHAGYTCGLWELFHIMTIGVYEWNQMATTKWDMIHTTKAADTLHDYIANFFTCEECRRNFLNSYDACEQNRCTRLGSSLSNPKEWKQLSLWLWETHNAVNVRLMKEQAERDGRMTTAEDEVKARWPSKLECQNCWGEDGTWEDETMFKFLRTQYWLDDDITAKYREELGLDEPVKLEIHDEDFDSSIMMSVVSWSPVGGVLTMILIWYIQKASKNKSGHHKKYDIS